MSEKHKHKKTFKNLRKTKKITKRINDELIRKKGDKMFEEDFFEVDELQYKTKEDIGNLDELRLNADQYIRAFK